MPSCESCGLPQWATTRPGVLVTLREKAATRFQQRDRRRSVWCCSESCAMQALAIAEMGPATHKWPITLAQFIDLERKRLQRRLDRYETPSQVADSTAAKNSNFEFLGLPHMEGKNVTKPQGGRPNKYVSNVERQRAYRQRQRKGTER